MFDATRLLGTLMRSSRSRRRLSRALRGQSSGVLGRAGVPGGALGLLGGVAIAAYEHWYPRHRLPRQPVRFRHPRPVPATPGPPPPPGAGASPQPAAVPPSPPPPPSSDAEQVRARLLIEAMIAAARADGEIDANERARVLKRLEEDGADAEAQRFVEGRMAAALDLDAPIAEVEGVAAAQPAFKAEVYAASLLAIDVDTAAERSYLDTLGQRLGLDSRLIKQIHASLGAPPPE